MAQAAHGRHDITDEVWKNSTPTFQGGTEGGALSPNSEIHKRGLLDYAYWYVLAELASGLWRME